VQLPTRKQADAFAYEAAEHYDRAGVRAMLDVAELRLARMRPRQRGRAAQAGAIAGLARRLAEMRA
jgi:hypothetical protein